jgi:hypothetical protein
MSELESINHTIATDIFPGAPTCFGIIGDNTHRRGTILSSFEINNRVCPTEGTPQEQLGCYLKGMSFPPISLTIDLHRFCHREQLVEQGGWGL